jgi:hypothetical protein
VEAEGFGSAQVAASLAVELELVAIRIVVEDPTVVGVFINEVVVEPVITTGSPVGKV